ncbi:MAG: sulfatase-like hydrolase/transferase [Saprospiraceae bacterium]|nr:sulfatase-like hydrolase/transferase [Saprospiraceae bacterium]
MKQFYTIVFLALFIARTNAQQNTILIIADDVSPDYFGFLSSNTDTAHTPNLYALSRRAVRFSKAWASPICSPTRAGIFTGRYSFRTGVGDVIMSASSPQISLSEMSIAKLLQAHAPIKYNTACVGKWHLNNNQPSKRLIPNTMGYDLYSGNFSGAIPSFTNYTRIKNGILDTVTTYATTQTVNDAIAWMDTMNTNKPFFLWLAFNAPHSPYHLPPANLCNTTGLSGTTAHINANPRLYFKAALEALDTEIGRLIQYLQENNFIDSTNIIFIGDNGNAPQVAQITRTSRAKNTIYDYGVRVPFMAAGPAVVNPNRVSSELVNTQDLFATIAELSGFSNWSNSIPNNTIIDSRSFLPILKNQAGTIRSWIFSEQFSSTADPSDGKTIRNQDYHLLRFDNGKEEFYNQTIDPEENNNLLIGSMNSTDIANYNFLCDSISLLTGTGSDCLTLSTKHFEIDDTADIYPNPFSSYLSIGKNKNGNIQMLNSFGQVIYQGNSLEKQDFSYLSNGVYMIIIGINQYRKVVKN